MTTALYAADFANIEGRVLAWLAGETWKLDAFRAYDAGTGPDLYKVAAAGIYSTSIDDVSKPERQVGKVAELALGYQGGVGAFVSMGKNYGLKEKQLAAMLDAVLATATGANIDKAARGWADRGRKSELGEAAWTACELVKLAWRDRHPMTVAYWADIEMAALAATQVRGRATQCRGVKFVHHAGHLWCQLPSGRALCYPFAADVRTENRFGKAERRLIYFAVDQFTRRWGRKAYYGGLGAENVTQAVARDIMAEAMVRVDRAGYPVVLTVHDEVVSEREAGTGDLAEFEQLMTALPAWADGLPVTAEAWRGARYRK